MKSGYLIAACLAIAAQPASAAEWWVMIQRDGSGNVHFADTSQMRRVGDRVTMWTHIFYRRAIGEMKSARVQHEVDCDTHSMRERRYLDFDTTHNVIRSGDNTDEDGWKEVAPDSTGAIYVLFACGTPEDRKAGYLSLDAGVDLFSTADFFLDPSPVVRVQ